MRSLLDKGKTRGTRGREGEREGRREGKKGGKKGREGKKGGREAGFVDIKREGGS